MDETALRSIRANRIMQAGIDSSEVVGVVKIAAEVLDAELVVTDWLLCPLACTSAAVADPAWEDLMEKGLVPSLTWMAEYEKQSPLREKHKCRLYAWGAVSDGRRLLAEIERGGKKLGYLSVTARSAERDADFEELVMTTAGVLSMQLENKSGHLGANSVFGHYLIALIENNFNSDDGAEELTAETGLKPQGFYTLVLVDISHYSVRQKSLHAFRISVERALHVTRSTIYKERLVLLLSARSAAAAEQRDYTQFSELLAANNTYAAVSRTCTTLWGLSPFYEGANKVLSRSFCAPAGVRVLSAENMGIYFVVDALLKMERPSDLIDPRVRMLTAYDKDNGTHYVETLLAYLRHSRKPALTCEALHIHRNTLDYRLQKIVDMTGADWSDGDLCFRLYLSMTALRYYELAAEHSKDGFSSR